MTHLPNWSARVPYPSLPLSSLPYPFISFHFFFLLSTWTYLGANIPHTPAQTAHHSASKQVPSCLCQVEEEEEAPIVATIMIIMAMDREMDKIEIITTTTTTITITTIIVIATKVCRSSLCRCFTADFCFHCNVYIHCFVTHLSYLWHLLHPTPDLLPLTSSCLLMR